MKGKKLSEEGGKIITVCKYCYVELLNYFYYFFIFKKVQRNIHLPQICAVVVGSLVCSLSIFIFLNPEVDAMFLPSENNKMSRVI